MDIDFGKINEFGGSSTSHNGIGQLINSLMITLVSELRWSSETRR